MGFIFENSMYFYEYEGCYYAYSFLRHVLIIVEEKTYESVATNQKTAELERLRKIWEKTGMINSVEDASIYIPQIKQVQFSFAPVHECNLRCKYCFADHGENFDGEQRKISTEMVDKILDFVFFKQFASCSEYRMDFVSGGEPLLNFEIIRYTIEKSKWMLRGTGKRLDIFLVTNGTIYNPEMLEYFDNNNVSIGISIDGDKETHNRNRYYADGTGSYEKVINTISLIKKSANLSRHTKDIWGLTVITGESQDMPGIIRHHHEMGINRMQMELVRGEKNIDFAISSKNVSRLIEEYKKLTAFFLDEIYQGNFESLKMILNENDYFGKIICRIIDGGRMFYRCSAGIGKINFDAQGNIYPCEWFVGIPEYCIGNVEKGMDESKIKCFYEENVDLRTSCRECWARYICGGDCYYNSYIVNGEIYAPDQCFCQVNKKMIEYALTIMISLKKKGLYQECADFIRMRKILSNAAGGSNDTKRNRTLSTT